MAYVITTALRKLDKLKKRIKAVTGGTSASKTISIIQILIDKCQRDVIAGAPGVTSITSETMPHLKRGAIRDFLNIMQEQRYFDPVKWNKSDFIYDFGDGVILEFFSLDMPHKVRGPRRKRLFINEVNNVSKETFDQLEVRTEEEIWMDWNPVNSFWFYEGENGDSAVIDREDVDFITLTYKDNEGLSQSIIATIESRKANKRWWRVYGEGLLGEVEGKIYSGWNLIDDIPPEAILRRYGLDFGYTNDPTVVEAIYYWNGAYIIDEVIYQKGLSNKTIADILQNLPPALVVADSAEPKSIDEIHSYGVNIVGAKKGQGSVMQGIQWVQQQKIFVTKRSLKTLKGYRNYLWTTDKDGRIINEPDDTIHEWSNPMDAVRYGLDSFRPLTPIRHNAEVGGVLPYIPGVG